MSAVDVNVLSICGEHPIGERVYGNIFADPAIHSDAVKVTDSSNGYIKLGHVKGGKEDCLDINNHAHGIVIEAELWEPQGQYLLTDKGASQDITVIGPVRGHGKTVDVDLGNISDQSDDITGPVLLNLTHESGDPITVRVLGAFRPIILNPDEQQYRFVFELPDEPWIKSLFLKAYKFLKRLGLSI